MQKQKIQKFFLPVGLLLLSSTFFINYLVKVPDFIDGFTKGAGLGLIILAFIQSRKKRACQPLDPAIGAGGSATQK